MGKKLKNINKKVNPKKLFNLKSNLEKVNNYIDKSKIFFSNLDKLLDDDLSTKEDIKNMYINLKDDLGVI